VFSSGRAEIGAQSHAGEVIGADYIINMRCEDWRAGPHLHPERANGQVEKDLDKDFPREVRYSRRGGG
jgi:hypothetical protein